MDEPFTEEERAALDSWQVDDGPDVVEAVMARSESTPPPGRFWLGIAVSLLLIGMVFGLGALQSSEVRGEHRAARRQTVEVGPGAVAVMEAGSALRFEERDGLLRLEQSAGDVFYRVDPRPGRSPFVIVTSEGTVTVVGTCFSVEVQEMKKGVIGAAAGSLVTSLVMVTVYEGKVVTASDTGETPVVAGERAELVRGRLPRKETRTPEQAEWRKAPDLGATPGQADFVPGRLPELVAANRTLTKEKQSLEEEVARLSQALEKAEARGRDAKTYDLDQPTLEQMAERCELRWDSPGLGANPQKVRTKDLEALGLAESEREVIDRKLRESHERLLAEVRKSYTEITGDENTGSLASSAMFAEARDKVPKAEVQRVFQALAQERAGLRAPPETLEGLPPLERLYRVLTGEGDRLQQALADELGPETAKSLRDLHQGWGSRSRSSHGCPR